MFSSYVAVSYKQMGKIKQKQLAESEGRIINVEIWRWTFTDESRQLEGGLCVSVGSQWAVVGSRGTGDGLVSGSVSGLASGSHSEAKVVPWCFSPLSAERGSLCSAVIESSAPAWWSQRINTDRLVFSRCSWAAGQICTETRPTKQNALRTSGSLVGRHSYPWLIYFKSHPGNPVYLNKKPSPGGRAEQEQLGVAIKC